VAHKRPNPSAAAPLDSSTPAALAQSLRLPAGIAWLKNELAARQRELITGPANQGWRFNEPLRPALEERIAFLEALVRDLQSL
jgi:hypothetical protein